MIETIEKIKDLLNRYGIKKDKITPETTMQSLRMVSEEIDAFFDDFGKEFDIDGEGFNYYDYFLEQVHPGHVIENLFYKIFKPEKLKRKSLTISHLVKVADGKKWFNPD